MFSAENMILVVWGLCALSADNYNGITGHSFCLIKMQEKKVISEIAQQFLDSKKVRAAV